MSTSEHVSLAIDGMSCGHCVASVRTALDAVPGVTDATVSVGAATFAFAIGTGSPEQVTADALRAIREAGYAASPGALGIRAAAPASCCSTPTVHQLGRS